MIDSLLKQSKEICQKHNIKPARSKGQNFLVNEAVYDRIVEAAELKADDAVLEVGPGLGILTEKLAARCRQVVAVELDDKLALLLKEKIKEKKLLNVEVVNADILDLISNSQFPISKQFSITKLSNKKKSTSKIENFKVVANLPYNITSVFLRKVYELENKPELMVLMLQKEVAERIAAKPGQMSKLSVMCQVYAEPEILFKVPKSDFWPSPEVDSAVIRLIPPPGGGGCGKAAAGEVASSKYQLSDVEGFFRLIRISFAQKRKMLKNNLANGYHVSPEEAEGWLFAAGFKPNIRAQELGVGEWKWLLSHITHHSSHITKNPS